jgi:hypothetical protein
MTWSSALLSERCWTVSCSRAGLFFAKTGRRREWAALVFRAVFVDLESFSVKFLPLAPGSSPQQRW